MGRKKASDARRKALEREEKMWRNDKLSFIAAVVTFIISILHRVFFKPDVMTGEQGLRTVFMFSLLRIILGLAAEVSFGVALGRLMLIQRSEPLAYAADAVEAKFSSGKKKKKQGKAGKVIGFVLTYAFVFLIYMSFGARETALYSQRNIRGLPRLDNLSYVCFAGETLMDMSQGETVTVRVSGCHIGTDSISYSVSTRRFNRNRRGGLTYRFFVLMDDGYDRIAQVSDKEAKKLESRLDPEKVYTVKLYKHSGFIASVEESE